MSGVRRGKDWGGPGGVSGGVLLVFLGRAGIELSAFFGGALLGAGAQRAQSLSQARARSPQAVRFAVSRREIVPRLGSSI